MKVEIFDVRNLGSGHFSLGLRSLGRVVSYIVTLSNEPVVGVSGPNSLWNLLRGNKGATSELLRVVTQVSEGHSVKLPKELLIEDDEFRHFPDDSALWASRESAWFLSRQSLTWASKHLTKRNSNTLFPVPFEHQVIGSDEDFNTLASRINLWGHEPRDFRQLWVPKSTAGRRCATQLDPLDAFIMTAIIYELGEIIERNRIPTGERVVCSFRFRPTEQGDLWDNDINYEFFQNCTLDFLSRPETIVVAETDISSFYHTLKPSIVSTQLERSGVHRKHAESLRRLLLFIEPDGLPVGPSFTAMLAEAVLAPIDQHLLSTGLKFVRFNDDYRFFCRSEFEAQCALQTLADALLETAGLRMQESKTKISNKDDVIERLEGSWLTELYADDDFEEEDSAKLLRSARIVLEKSVDETHVAWVRLFREAFKALPLEDKKEVLPLVLRHLARVWGIAPQVSRSLEALLVTSDGGRDLLQLVYRQLENQIEKIPDYSMSWILHAFWRDEWQGKEELSKLDLTLTADHSASRRELLIALRDTESATAVSYDRSRPWQLRAHIWATGHNEAPPSRDKTSAFRSQWLRLLHNSIAAGSASEP